MITIKKNSILKINIDKIAIMMSRSLTTQSKTMIVTNMTEALRNLNARTGVIMTSTEQSCANTSRYMVNATMATNVTSRMSISLPETQGMTMGLLGEAEEEMIVEMNTIGEIPMTRGMMIEARTEVEVDEEEGVESVAEVEVLQEEAEAVAIQAEVTTNTLVISSTMMDKS